ncbi:MAG: DUF58 domain-containing protein [Polyangiaceae bacterium]|nr:DUF58 domain-containing protein [Polyangiaceae bacterium]
MAPRTTSAPKAPAPKSPFNWAGLASLRLRARAIADGVYAGAHASTRKGAGVEFGGHRPYAPGDDLRLLDRRATLRHDRPIVRELQTETDRTLRLLVDASASMAYGGRRAPVTKFAFAAALSGALARVALASGDPVSLEVLGGKGARSLPASGGRESFERLLAALASVEPGGDLSDDLSALERSMAALARSARRGSVLVLVSDLVDTHPETPARFAALGSGGKSLIALRVLDPDERLLPFEGPLRLQALEGAYEIETEAGAVRAGYRAALEESDAAWAKRLEARGGALVKATTADDPVGVVRELLRAVARGAR